MSENGTIDETADLVVLHSKEGTFKITTAAARRINIVVADFDYTQNMIAACAPTVRDGEDVIAAGRLTFHGQSSLGDNATVSVLLSAKAWDTLKHVMSIADGTPFLSHCERVGTPE